MIYLTSNPVIMIYDVRYDIPSLWYKGYLIPYKGLQGIYYYLKSDPLITNHLRGALACILSQYGVRVSYGESYPTLYYAHQSRCRAPRIGRALCSVLQQILGTVVVCCIACTQRATIDVGHATIERALCRAYYLYARTMRTLACYSAKVSVL
jgi:hypothetical protein